jgi:hypothetical protein
MQDPAQVTLLINNCQWVIMVEKGFAAAKSDKKSYQQVL